MSPIQHPQLHILECSDVVDQLCASGGKVRALPIHKVILHRPLTERFMHNRSGVMVAGQ